MIVKPRPVTNLSVKTGTTDSHFVNQQRQSTNYVFFLHLCGPSNNFII